MQKITSRDNKSLKFARKVGAGLVKEQIFVEGTRLANEVLKSSLVLTEVFLSEHFTKTQPEFVERLGTANTKILPDKVFDSIAKTKSSQGIVVLCKTPATGKHLIEAKFQNKRFTLPITILLHRISNPSNLGAVLRIAEAVGAAGVIITRESADAFSPKALRSAMGASFRMPIWTGAEFDSVLAWANEHHLVSTCADIRSDQNYLKTDWQRPRLLIFGSEANGLSDDEFYKTEEQIKIPMENEVESLNLAVSCGVLLFEAKRNLD